MESRAYRTKRERILRVGAILSAKLEKRRSSCEATIRTIRAKRDAQGSHLAREVAALKDRYDLEARAIDAAMHAEVEKLTELCTTGSVTVQLVIRPEGLAGREGPLTD